MINHIATYTSVYNLYFYHGWANQFAQREVDKSPINLQDITSYHYENLYGVNFLCISHECSAYKNKNFKRSKMDHTTSGEYFVSVLPSQPTQRPISMYVLRP